MKNDLGGKIIIYVPFRRELYAASSRGRYENAFSVTGLWSMNENTQCTWLWNTSSSFLSSGDFVSEVWVLWNALGGVPILVSVSDTRWHTRLMRWAKSNCSRGNLEGIRSVLEGMECVHCEPFSLGKLRSRLSLFSRELGRSSAPRGSGPAIAEAARRLRSRRSQMELADEPERGIFHLALVSGWRVNCWRKMYCLLHLLIQQEVLCWLMVGWWRRRGYFWAFSACLPRVCRAAGGYEVCASARLDLQWRHGKGGVARSRLDERSLSVHKLPWASHSFQILIVRSCRHGINHIQPASIGISMLIMLTSKGGASTDMRRCPLGGACELKKKKRFF